MEKPVTTEMLFWEIDRCLVADSQPSDFIINVSEEVVFKKPPFDKLYALKSTGQNPKYHPEGSVWNHTMLVVDMAASVRAVSRNARAFMWAALLHDIGKAPTTRMRKGKLTSYNHDIVGAKLAKEFLSCFITDDTFICTVSNLVRWHMQVLFAAKQPHSVNIREMAEKTDLRELALLGLCDRFGRLYVDRDSELKSVRDFLRLCEKVSGVDFSDIRILMEQNEIFSSH